MTRTDALALINAERERQDAMWGREFDDKNTLNDWATYIAWYATDICMDYPKEKTPEEVVTSMKKVAALAVAVMERDGVTAKRHYDKS